MARPDVVTVMSGGVSSSLQSEQFQLKIRHAKSQCKLRKPKKFRQMFLDGCHVGLLCKVKRDPASVPFESRILSASIEDH